MSYTPSAPHLSGGGCDVGRVAVLQDEERLRWHVSVVEVGTDVTGSGVHDAVERVLESLVTGEPLAGGERASLKNTT